ncbi:MAG: hypothetical protein AAGD13_02465 [Pseudomonadota bacterium]
MEPAFFPELVERMNGPLRGRLLLQPALASFFAIRDGMRDAREGLPPYLYALVFRKEQRRDRIAHAWSSAGMVAIMAFALDSVFQLITQGEFRPLDAAIMACLLCALPYTLLRGPAARIARRRLWARPDPDKERPRT